MIEDEQHVFLHQGSSGPRLLVCHTERTERVLFHFLKFLTPYLYNRQLVCILREVLPAHTEFAATV